MKKKITLLFLNFIFLFILAAQSTPVENLYRYTLDNGLELFIAENDAAPLVYIEVAVRGGGIAQTQENAGLFHLYEHMMFKGNSKYRDAASVQSALNKMGVTDWNGSTGIEWVNYYYTVPSKVLEEGIEFWNYAIREPLLDEKEFENEKKVVLSEIEGNASDPQRILSKKLSGITFPLAPYKLDPGGLSETIKKAELDDLKKIKEEYYVPNNTALFIGGDVKAQKVYELVNKIWGSWKKADDPWKKDNFCQDKNPFCKNQFVVIPYSKMSEQFAQICVRFRGPDTAFDVKSTYAADVLSTLFDDPKGIFKSTMTENKFLAIPNEDYVWMSYPTRRKSALIEFGAVITEVENKAASRTKEFAKLLKENVIDSILKNENIFSQEQMQMVAQKIRDNQIYECETAAGLLTTLRFWWICDSADYYFDYLKNIESTSYDDIKVFLEKYIESKNPLVYILINPSVYEKTKNEFMQEGFTVINLEAEKN